jgi:hypothetical protein
MATRSPAGPGVAAIALLLAVLPAQTLTLQNLAPLPREEWVSVVVPFAQGAVSATPELHAEGRPTVWQPFGARWPDGSLRQALCLFRAALPALAEVQVALHEGTGPALPEGDPALPPFELEFALRQGEHSQRAVVQPVGTLEDNPARKVALLRARVGTSGLVAEAIVTAYRGQAHAWADVAVFFSDPTSPAMQCDLDELTVECRGMALLLRHPGRSGIEQQTTPTGSRAVLLQKTALGDGQGIRRTGVLLPPRPGDGGIGEQTLTAAAVCPVLGATPWTGTGAFGAFGLVPEPPPWLQGMRLRPALAQRHREFVQQERARPGDPFWNGPLGLARQAGQTGDQEDFGVVKLSAVAHSGLGSLLLEAEASVLQEACRPVHFFEADGAPVRPADHPDWVVWSGRTHWHPGVSRDRLGKPHPEPRFQSHGWSGKDREHWSSNNLGAFALLTGAHWARAELQNEARLYLAGQTVTPHLSTSNSGPPRAGGRTELAACWIYLATGDQELFARVHERFDRVYRAQWAGRELPPEAVRPMTVHHPDPRMLKGAVRYWTPWEDGLCAVGFAAAHRVFGNDNARLLAEELALNVVRHGFKLDERECIIATAMRWQDGAPLSGEQLASGDPTVVLWSYGTAFSEWAIGAVEIARATAQRRGDDAIRQRAETILQRVRAGRQKPRHGFYDRLTEWDAARW